MKRLPVFVWILCCFVLCVNASAYAAQKMIPGFCTEILESWGTTSEEELQQAILTYWEENAPNDWKETPKDGRTPVSFWFGGTAEELIANHKKWDVAIVSSKEADLQKLVDAGCVHCYDRAASPDQMIALEQWPYPEAVQRMLPQHPLYYYDVYCYSYDAEKNEAVFLIVNEKGRPLRPRCVWAQQILAHRSPEQIRAVDGLCRAIDWDNFGMPELSLTEEELLANPDGWDWAFLRIDKEDRLEKLDAAGLLYEFSQDAYWADRDPHGEQLAALASVGRSSDDMRGCEWTEPAGLLSADGRMIAIPYREETYNAENEISVFVVNAKSPVLSRALEYARHYIKSCEWYCYGRLTYSSDIEEMRKLRRTFEPGDAAIFKKDVNW